MQVLQQPWHRLYNGYWSNWCLLPGTKMYIHSYTSSTTRNHCQSTNRLPIPNANSGTRCNQRRSTTRPRHWSLTIKCWSVVYIQYFHITYFPLSWQKLITLFLITYFNDKMLKVKYSCKSPVDFPGLKNAILVCWFKMSHKVLNL
jgi:hypothetical protein